ncbi:MAG TPA: hypothetical protein VFC47_11350 [Caulobacteraceae bacterium]|nr:hypothetical protein [Caulobacteraceae bacterium]
MTDEPLYPAGSPEALEQYRRMKAEIDVKLGRGKRALIDDVDEWRPEPPPTPADDDPDPPGGEPSEDSLRHDHVMIARLFGKVIRQVPISLPDPCPITPLGKLGRLYFYLDPMGQLVALADAEHGQAHIAGLWSPRINDLNSAFPQFNQQGKFQGFRANYARDAMMSACALKGIFEAHDKVRGRGCWKGDGGELIQHLGDRILVGAVEHKPGEIDGYVYPGRPPMPAPKAGGKADCEEIYRRFKTWNWKRGELDARLLLGQQASTVLSAALKWRPMGFICGGAGTGKSTLQEMVRAMLPGRLLGTVDASEASLRGLLGQDAVGVSFDEIEADATNDRAQQVMKLARTAASGDDAYRSSANQEIRQFTLRSSFLFSAIIPPSMRPQDAQRFAFLLLHELPKTAKLEPLAPARARDMGAGLVGRITEAWPRWQKALDAFVGGLERVGHAQRGAMQFGTLLAAAHVVLHDHDPDETEVAVWCEQLRRSTLLEYENDTPAWLKAWRILMGAQPDVWRSDGSPTVAEVVRKYLALSDGVDAEEARIKLRAQLERTGLAIVRGRADGRHWLAIPPAHQGVAEIFAGSDFQKRGGEGAWFFPLRGAPPCAGGEGVLNVQVVHRLNSQKCALFWLDAQIDLGGGLTPIFQRQVAEDLVEDIEREPGQEG